MTTNEGNLGGSLSGSQDIRIGDTERNAALTALGEHLATGRLDMDEYGARSAQVSTARTSSDLQALFADLPAPRPAVLQPAAPSYPAPVAQGYPQPLAQPPGQPGQPMTRSKAQQIAAGLTGVSGIIAVVLYFLLNDHWDQAWLVFLLIPVAYGIASAVWGPDWKNDGRRDRNRNR